MGMDLHGRNPKNEVGKYFRADIWSWRPIYSAIVESEIIKDYKMLDLMSYNEGAGPENQETCDKLAFWFEGRAIGYGDHDLIGLGEFASGKCRDMINEQISIIEETIPASFKGDRPVYATDGAHLRKFITFLRNCGGFRVY